MPPAKSLSVALCLLLLTMPLRAETPNVANLDRSPDPESRQYKIMIPEEVDGKTYNQWIDTLKYHDPYNRVQALLALLAFGDKAADAVPEVNKMVQGDRDASVRTHAIYFIANVTKINPQDEDKSITTLCHSIGNDRQSIVRYQAAQAITRFGKSFRNDPEKRKNVVADLVRGLGDTSTFDMRKACITALIVAGVDAKDGPEPRVTDALILRTKTYYEPSNIVRLEAIIALGAMGKPHDANKLRQVLGALHDHYHSKDKAIRIWTHVSLMALEDKIVKKDINMIVKYLKDSDREVRRHAVTALGAMEKRTSEHVKDICDLLETEEETMVQKAACTALTHMGDKGPRVINTLIRLTKLDKRKSVEAVLAACAALAYFHVDSPEVLAALEAVLKHNSLDDREKEIVKGYIKVLKTPLKDAPKKKAIVGKK